MKRHIALVAILLLLVTLTACGGGETTATTASEAEATTTEEPTTTVTEADATTATEEPTTERTTNTTWKPTSIVTLPKVTTTTTTTAATTVGTTTARQGACDLAAAYLAEVNFSYSGLIKQLQAAGCSEEDAIYAADNCGADWNEQAALRAKYHLNGMGFGRQQLITWMLQEGFTESQVAYALEANNV